MKCAKINQYAKLKSAKSLIAENIFDKSSLVYLTDIADNPEF